MGSALPSAVDRHRKGAPLGRLLCLGEGIFVFRYLGIRFNVEGTENLRQRGIHRRGSTGMTLELSDPNLSSAKGEQSAKMAGSTRIIRYVLFAFFVSGIYLQETSRAKE